jgi:hypothetical protein
LKLPGGKAAFWLDLLVSGLLPWLLYDYLQPRVGEAAALGWSAVPPGVLAVLELIVVRRIDAVSALSLGGIALSLLIVALGGDARMILVRESYITAAIGLVGLSSLAWRRPAPFLLAKAAAARGDLERERAFEQQWELAGIRRAMRMLTAVWSGGFVLEALLRGYLAWRLPSGDFLMLSPFVQYGSFGLLLAWTFWYRRRLLRPAGAYGAVQ